jgi:hypothetical protein
MPSFAKSRAFSYPLQNGERHWRHISIGGAGISIGAYADGVDTRLGAWVWNNPSATAVRAQLLDAADRGNLPTTWARSRVGWKGLHVHTQLGVFADQNAATTWLVERLCELDGVGILKLLPALGLPVAGDDEGLDEDH